MEYSLLEQKDPDVYKSLIGEISRQKNGIELIASENYVSNAVLEAMGSHLTNKYSEGMPNNRYYGGNEYIDEVENLAVNRAKELFGAEHVNVQPYSGSPANLAIYLAFLEPGDSILGMGLADGGHLTHGFKVSVTGKWFNSHSYGVNSNGYIDYNDVRKIAHDVKPKLIWVGFSAYSRNIDWGEFRKIADEVGAILAVDIAHIAGLIAGKQIESPVPIADVVTTTTHKTLRGPRGAMIMSKKEYAKIIDRAVFPGLQGGPHNHTTAAIAVALGEALDNSFVEYAKQVIMNAQALALQLQSRSFNVISGGTDNHLMLINVIPKGVSGKEAEEILEKAGITLNKNVIPGELRKPFDPSGVRIGTPAITTRGLEEEHMEKIADLIEKAIANKDSEIALKTIKKEVREFMEPFPIPGIS